MARAHASTEHPNVKAPEAHRAALQAWIAAEGETAVTRHVGLSPLGIARVLDGLPVFESTCRLLAEGLAARQEVA
jgi:hypothetical protein